jgi:hypothetical protein
VKKYGPTIDVVAKRYGKTPSQVVEFDSEYNHYYCFQFDLAIAGSAMVAEARAHKKAYAEAEQKAKQNSPGTAPDNKENPAFTKEYREHLKQVETEITADGSGNPKKLNHEAIFKKMNDFNSRGKRININDDPHS